VSAEPREYLSPPQVAELLGMSVATLARWRRYRQGPAWYRCGDRAVRYRRVDVDAWLSLARVENTSVDENL
jgi:predicted DNA-binding transcriptional regulator AlpA